MHIENLTLVLITLTVFLQIMAHFIALGKAIASQRGILGYITY